MKKSYIFLATLGILAVAAVVIYALYSVSDRNNDERFSISGSGTVYAKADIANLTVGFKTGVKTTAADATKENSEKMNDIIAVIKGLGIEEKDIKTTGYSLSPVYNWTERDGQKLVGYEVSQNAQIKIRDLEKIGDVIADTTEKGANQIGSIDFTIDDEYELKNQARELAIEKAKEKAAMIASQTGMELGEIKGFYESAEYPVAYSSYSNAKVQAAGKAEDSIAAPSIEAGQNEIKVEVTLSYEVK